MAVEDAESGAMLGVLMVLHSDSLGVVPLARRFAQFEPGFIGSLRYGQH
jgi:hypothetical protein